MTIWNEFMCHNLFFFIITEVILTSYNILLLPLLGFNFFDFNKSCETLKYVARLCLFMYNISNSNMVTKTP